MNNVYCDGGYPTRALRACCCLLTMALAVWFCPTALGQAGSGFDHTLRMPQQEQTPELREPQFNPIGPQMNVAAVRFQGNRQVSDSRMQSLITTRANRVFDPQVVQSDVRKLISSRLFADVRTYREDTPEGVVVTFQVVERGLIEYVRFIGNAGASDRTLRKEAALAVGEAMDQFSVEEGKRRLEDYYHRSGYSLASVSIVEGLNSGDRGVAYMIDEGPKQRVRWTSFEGNEFVSDAVLRTHVESTPGYFWIFSKAQPDVIDEDVRRVEDYYKSMGFFFVRVGRTVEYSADGGWADITFYVEEGPRYQVRDIQFRGNHRFSDDELAQQLELRAGEEFFRQDLQGDVGRIRDLYGGQGYVFADIHPDVQLLEEPGMLDLVYDIQEGDQYRVGDIRIQIVGQNGGEAVTSESVVINTMSLNPGDILDTRQLRESERKLGYIQVFQSGGPQGLAPQISVVPPEMQEDGGSRRMASVDQPPIYRAQNDEIDRSSPWQPPASPAPQAAGATYPQQAPAAAVQPATWIDPYPASSNY